MHPLEMHDLDVDGLVAGDKCELAKQSHNDARLMLLALAVLTLLLATAVVVASIWTFIAFDDDQDSRGWLALIAAVAGGAAFALLARLTTDARKQERAMWRRVDKACPSTGT